MPDNVKLEIKIEGKEWVEYLKMDVKKGTLWTLDHIEIEMDHEKAKAFFVLLGQSLSRINDSDNRRSKNEPRESQNGI